jgi:hypothetical protein
MHLSVTDALGRPVPVMRAAYARESGKVSRSAGYSIPSLTGLARQSNETLRADEAARKPQCQRQCQCWGLGAGSRHISSQPEPALVGFAVQAWAVAVGARWRLSHDHEPGAAQARGDMGGGDPGHHFAGGPKRLAAVELQRVCHSVFHIVRAGFGQVGGIRHAARCHIPWNKARTQPVPIPGRHAPPAPQFAKVFWVFFSKKNPSRLRMHRSGQHLSRGAPRRAPPCSQMSPTQSVTNAFKSYRLQVTKNLIDK